MDYEWGEPKLMNDSTTNGLFTNWSNLPGEIIAEGIQRQMVTGENVMICRLKFEPRLVTPAHDHPHEQMTIVERGSVLFTIGSEQRVAKTGDILHFPSGGLARGNYARRGSHLDRHFFADPRGFSRSCACIIRLR